MQPDSIILALARHVLALVGSWLVSRGYIGQAESEQFVGAMLVLGALAWSVANKFKVGQVIQSALDAPAGTARADLKPLEKAKL